MSKAAELRADVHVQIPEFPVGADVVAENSDGELVWGHIESKSGAGLVITRTARECTQHTFVAWADLVFIANDGFPVYPIHGMTYEQAVDICDNSMGPMRPFRKALTELVEKERRNREPRRRTLGGGGPFVFEDIYIRDLKNPGNNGPQWWGHPDEEELVLESPDGATMLSYDLSHVFLFDGLTLPGYAPPQEVSDG